MQILVQGFVFQRFGFEERFQMVSGFVTGCQRKCQEAGEFVLVSPSAIALNYSTDLESGIKDPASRNKKPASLTIQDKASQKPDSFVEIFGYASRLEPVAREQGIALEERSNRGDRDLSQRGFKRSGLAGPFGLQIVDPFLDQWPSVHVFSFHGESGGKSSLSHVMKHFMVFT